jgi:hypothetical protein
MCVQYVLYVGIVSWRFLDFLFDIIVIIDICICVVSVCRKLYASSLFYTYTYIYIYFFKFFFFLFIIKFILSCGPIMYSLGYAFITKTDCMLVFFILLLDRMIIMCLMLVMGLNNCLLL